MNRVERIIEVIKEVMVANSPGSGGGFSSQSPGEGPTAGYDSRVGATDLYIGRRGKVDYRKVPKQYRQWVKSLKNK